MQRLYRAPSRCVHRIPSPRRRPPQHRHCHPDRRRQWSYRIANHEIHAREPTADRLAAVRYGRAILRGAAIVSAKSAPSGAAAIDTRIAQHDGVEVNGIMCDPQEQRGSLMSQFIALRGPIELPKPLALSGRLASLTSAPVRELVAAENALWPVFRTPVAQRCSPRRAQSYT
jgi:hypothetical protein